ncbi:MAG: Oxidoreductase, aldo/keto reductase family, partial [uncultured Thermomicrobiales bacterium]
DDGGDPHPAPGHHRRGGLQPRPRRLPHRRPRARRGHPARPRRDRRRDHLHGQRLGVPRRRVRGPDGRGPGPGRLPRQGVPDDQELRPRPQSRSLDGQAGGEPAPPPHRRRRPLADPRGRLAGRPGPDLRPRRRRRGDAAGEGAGQGPLHRLHRPQEPGHLPPDAGAGAGLPLGRHPDAGLRLRLAFQLLPAGDPAAGRGARHRRRRDEEPRLRPGRPRVGRHPPGGDRLRPQPAGLDTLRRRRLDGDPGAGPRHRPRLRPVARRRDGADPGQGPRPRLGWPPRALQDLPRLRGPGGPQGARSAAGGRL